MIVFDVFLSALFIAVTITSVFFIHSKTTQGKPVKFVLIHSILYSHCLDNDIDAAIPPEEDLNQEE